MKATGEKQIYTENNHTIEEDGNQGFRQESLNSKYRIARKKYAVVPGKIKPYTIIKRLKK